MEKIIEWIMNLIKDIALGNTKEVYIKIAPFIIIAIIIIIAFIIIKMISRKK